MIRKFSVTGLNGSSDYNIDFNEDINIFTGKNGSGKTTLLKLLWYMYSPNIERTVPEIKFKTARLVTDKFILEILKRESKHKDKILINLKIKDKKEISIELSESDFNDPFSGDKVEQINRITCELPLSSVFFPTFRRIEGGFSLGKDRVRHPMLFQMANDLSSSIANYTKSMTVRNHKFVSSISTDDVEDLLTKQFADISEQTNKLHGELSDYISSTLNIENNDNANVQYDNKLLEARSKIENLKIKSADIENRRNVLMSPFTILSDIVSSIFKDKGVKITHKLILGTAKEAMQANNLSAGEKQMLSFLCYNAFSTKSPIFIDEPELSLHLDWQRILFSILLSQNTNNQFFVSTHSPFIYSKYPEKEIILGKDRGDNQCH